MPVYSRVGWVMTLWLPLASCGKTPLRSDAKEQAGDTRGDSGRRAVVDTGDHEETGSPPDSGTPPDSSVRVDLNIDVAGERFGDLFRAVNLDAGKQMTDSADYGRLERLMCPDTEACVPGPVRLWDKVEYGRFALQSPVSNPDAMSGLHGRGFPIMWTLRGTPATKGRSTLRRSSPRWSRAGMGARARSTRWARWRQE